MNRRWLAGLIAVAGLFPVAARADGPSGDPVADRFSFPVGAIPNSPTSSSYVGTDGRTHVGWVVTPAATFLSPGYGPELQPGDDWSGRGGAASDEGQPVYAAAAGTIVAAGYYGPSWGNVVLIRHTLPDGEVVLTQYGYLADIVKSAGTVDWRELIGHIGTGRRGSVLHFEVRRDDMQEFPADYWPSRDGGDADWVRAHYFSPSMFIRSHFRILTLAAPAAEPGTTGTTGGPSPLGGGTGATSGDTSSLGSSGGTGATPGTEPTANPAVPIPLPSSTGTGVSTTPDPAWDGVPHLDGSVLKSGAGSYYLLQNGKKWLILNDEVLSTWARPEEALPATDDELASYPDGSHPLGLRAGTLFQGPAGPPCLSSDPFDDAGLACWVFKSDSVFAAFGFTSSMVLPVSKQTMGLYIRPTLMELGDPLPRGMLIQQPFGGYYVAEDLTTAWPALHPVTSSAALHSWQMSEAGAAQISDSMFWERALKQAPLPFRPGSIVQSSSGQLYVVSGAYRYRVSDLNLFQKRGYSVANVIPVTDAELALEQEASTPLP